MYWLGLQINGFGLLVLLCLKSTKELKNKAVFNIVYVALWPLVMYFNCFKIASTMTFLVSRTTHLRYITILLYHFTINNDCIIWQHLVFRY